MSRSKARRFADFIKFFDIDYDNNRANIVGYSNTEEVDAKVVTAQEEVKMEVAVASTGRAITANETVFVSVAGQTITLPATPTEGDQVGIIVGDFEDTTVARNGSKIMGLDEDLTVDSANIGIELVYTDATNGWRFL